MVVLPLPVGPVEQDQAVRLDDRLGKGGQVGGTHAQPFQGQRLGLQGQQPHRHALAVLGGQGGQADVEALSGRAENMGEMAVLRGPLLGDVHAAQHLEAADHAVVYGDRKRADRFQHAVDAKPDVHLLSRPDRCGCRRPGA